MSSAVELISWMLDVSSNALGMKRSVSADDADRTSTNPKCSSADSPTGQSEHSRVSSPSLFVCSECGEHILQGSNVYCMMDKRFCSSRCRVSHDVDGAHESVSSSFCITTSPARTSTMRGSQGCHLVATRACTMPQHPL